MVRNPHMNLFDPYEVDAVGERNLVRSLALCLENEPVFLAYFLHDVLGACAPGEFNAIDLMRQDPEFRVNIEQTASNIDPSESVYGVVLTPERMDVDWGNVESEEKCERRADLVIQNELVTIVVEAKLSQSCGAPRQLKNQVERILEETGKCDGYAASSWEQIVSQLYETQDTLEFLGQNNRLVDDFCDLLLEQKPGWVSAKPLSEIRFDEDAGPKEYQQRQVAKRLRKIKALVAQEKSLPEGIDETGGRYAMSLKGWCHWAELANLHLREDGGSVALRLWPGDTKEQGKYLFRDTDLQWAEVDDVKLEGIEGGPYEAKIEPYIKFAHWRGASVFSLGLDRETARGTHNADMFEEIAGRKKRDEWDGFVRKLTEVLGNRWEDEGQQLWEENFERTDRTQVNVSLGYRVAVSMPYSTVRKLDREPEDTAVAPFVKEIASLLEELKKLIEGT